MNPTVSERSIRCAGVMGTSLTVESSVAKSMSSTTTPAPENQFRSVDFPAFVYPTSATRGNCSLPFRWTSLSLPISRILALRCVILVRIARRSVSICVSPGPFVPMPPNCLERCVHWRVRRGSMYCSWASSTCVFASFVLARDAKMSSMIPLLSMILHFISFSRLRTCTADRSSSNMMMSIFFSSAR